MPNFKNKENWIKLKLDEIETNGFQFRDQRNNIDSKQLFLYLGYFECCPVLSGNWVSGFKLQVRWAVKNNRSINIFGIRLTYYFYEYSIRLINCFRYNGVWNVFTSSELTILILQRNICINDLALKIDDIVFTNLYKVALLSIIFIKICVICKN